jgi:hypothetical protein
MCFGLVLVHDTLLVSDSLLVWLLIHSLITTDTIGSIVPIGFGFACCMSRKLPSLSPIVHTLPRRATQVPLRHYSGHAQEGHPKWFRQVDSSLQVSGILQIEISILPNDSDRGQFRATWAQKWDPWGIFHECVRPLIS